MTILASAWFSPTDYSLAADTGTSYQSVRLTGPKLARFGAWLVGGSGAIVQIQRAFRFLGASTESVPDPGPGRSDSPARPAIDAVLVALHAHLLEHAGPQSPDDVPHTGATFLLVGPAGIVSLQTCGAVLWHEGFAAIGAGAPFAYGCWDGVAYTDLGKRARRPTDEIAEVAVNVAIRRCVECFGSAVVLRADR